MPLKTTLRFLKYTGIGIPTAALDLSLVALATTYAHIPYQISVFLGYLIGVSVNYVLSRRYVFAQTRRKFVHGYLFMVGAAGAGAFLTTALTMALTESLGLYYLYARIGVSALIGIANYLFNLYVNFRVAGRH